MKLFKRRNKTSPLMTAYLQLKKQETIVGSRFLFDEVDFYPCLNDNTPNTGFDRHYIYHPAWAVRIVKQLDPVKHIDISSTLHFCTMLSAFVPTEFYDFRPARLELNNLKSASTDLTKLHFADDSIESLSCMHTVEHVGLGRYGDVLDYDGDLKAIAELKRVTAIGGSLLFVVSLGAKNVICFNAHRIYNKAQILSLFSDMQLMQFALIPEDEQDGGLVIDPSDELLAKQFYACGCFWFKKLN